MTPAINCAKKAKIHYQIHQYQHDETNASYGMEAAEKLAIDPHRVFKTLVVATDNKQLAVAVVPVATQLNLKAFAKAIGSKKVAMAEKQLVERTTGYVVGGVSPLGQRKPLQTIIDSSAESFTTIFVSAGRRGLEIELSATDLCNLTKGQIAAIGQ